mmetsp:Transcript_34859/g.74309  ORF Transcript_34859/g.74309 Transcript_34859/m.74309 type:complete len:429 (+) Transcript_34859:177-1463(+)|eukprot:CAMPEP_0172553276 /NCGR_PEP_ID=MMETSP1067-20121228/49802_1 /TAXON_ID=265564 ORGANISM="Thalassiosira punctigera, Strain Tpunct2005C2" /NCGR_SAMPLE_ID=MMETSP1067 /ASSEMBLY_ACC=CAM_ASM_000444 /LENGTH=428 /DNA_ID=CAMNT_0013341435 /DNA_START=177 /DNA_END=1463 /DNA_ORIENTATION=-
MSHIMMARRLVGGLRRPPSATCLVSPLENLSLQTHVASSISHRPLVLPCNHCFSSAAHQEDDPNSTIVELPPNLKFDPRAKSSPFYGVERVVIEKKKTKERKKKAQEKKKDEQVKIEPSSAASVDKESGEDEKASDDVMEAGSEIIDEEEEVMGEYDDDEEEYDSEDEDEEEERILYDLSTKPDVARVIPLPQRLHVPVMDIKTGEEVGTFHLSEKTFGNDPIRVDILHRVVVWQRNKHRGKRNAGARTKTVSEVSGSGRKVRPQKGQGKARAGHSRPAHWRGGAKAHGPKGRVQDYTTKLNKKVRKMGVRHALSQKLKEGNLIVTSDMAVPSHKTKELNVMLNRFGIAGKTGSTALLIDDADPNDAESEASVYGGLDVNFKVASGNLGKIKMLNQKGCHVYSMLKFKKLVLSLAAVQSLEERLEKDL